MCAVLCASALLCTLALPQLSLLSAPLHLELVLRHLGHVLGRRTHVRTLARPHTISQSYLLCVGLDLRVPLGDLFVKVVLR